MASPEFTNYLEKLNKAEKSPEHQALMFSRKLHNSLIINKIVDYCNENPGMRFFQALTNLGIIENNYGGTFTSGIIDKYDEESEATFKKLKL